MTRNIVKVIIVFGFIICKLKIIKTYLITLAPIVLVSSFRSVSKHFRMGADNSTDIFDTSTDFSKKMTIMSLDLFRF